ncbi:hypothetical protein GUITHDRAFT_89301 [Guillardia theta CCMP2712]|uniref:Glutaredoxin domain-containing protein n=1 Tax=Guillardia theta (strain CCMP2712) TaxID=905079 RepID=L1IQX6_GUITC|nr:hypothetical protein GUITHDRAFT_89301 [Guillardia theta CCMP2712]EKX38663.1 hypothetical protein GUITHDRAFT_89301 [Guillardia theta CCMP2712]|eukprot:XP_005825643.1 hypothetical protein GUITHDRAFT_89301 [Guillardia theta CCMP2712]
MAPRWALVAMAMAMADVGGVLSFQHAGAIGTRIGTMARRAAVSPPSPLRLAMKEQEEKPEARGNFLTNFIYNLEMLRVSKSSETPTADNGGWSGEPKEWALEGSFAQKASEISQKGFAASIKQWIAESIAGEYDKEAVNKRIDETIARSPVAMFSFSKCPFCLRSKELLLNEIGIDKSNIKIIECDEDPQGNAIRAELGKRTGRTSMPSIWIREQGFVGGCNDGPGIVPLHKEGKLRGMLEAAKAL